MSAFRSTVVRLLRRGALTLLGCYVAIVVLMVVFENALVYHPTPAARDWRRSAATDVEDLRLTTPTGPKLHAWWYPRPEARGALLLLHGNAGNVSYVGSWMRRMRVALDVPVLAVDYPGYGRSEGNASEAGCYEAADAAYDWLIERGVAPSEVILFGDSLGGGVAVDVASRRPHRALLLHRTFPTLPDVGASVYPWLPARWLMRNRFDSVTKIAACSQPILIAHGTADTLIPFSLGQRLYEAAPAPKQFLPLEGQGHFDDLSGEFLAAARSFLDNHAPLP